MSGQEVFGVISRVAGSPDSHVVISERLNFLNVGKLSSSLLSRFSLCLERHNGPARERKNKCFSTYQEIGQLPMHRNIPFCLRI